MTFKPLNGYVLIEQDKLKEEKDGIYLPGDRDEAPPPLGTVISSSVMDIPEGTRVLFKPHLFDELTIEDKTFKVGQAAHVVATVC